MKKDNYRSPQTVVLTVCESEMICSSIPDGGSALENDITDGDSRLDFAIEEFNPFGVR